MNVYFQRSKHIKTHFRNIISISLARSLAPYLSRSPFLQISNWMNKLFVNSLSNGCSSFRHRVNFATPTHHSCGMNRCCHSNHCVNRMPNENEQGRLHKSLSFAFQTPMTWNDGYRTYHGVPSYATVSRAHSR